MSIFIAHTHLKRIKTGLAGVFAFSLLTFPALAVDKIQMPCEVLEVSGSAKTLSDAFKKVHFVLIHHANAADRERLSKWLKEESGTEVAFSVRGHIHRGILYRLGHCFGRGLLLYMDTIDIKARDIIEVSLPRSPSP